MAASAPEIRTVSKIKSSLLQPALTSHYECFFAIPNTFPSQRQGTVKKFVEQSVPINQELLILSCSEASLPGSNLATHELNNDFTGVTQRHAYRRLYDDRADFTFYVNDEYNQIRVFERWMQFIIGEQEDTAPKLETFYRVSYPKSYKTTIYITKFERTAKAKTGKGKQNETNGSSYSSKKLYYSFYNAFPISITSMPVSYDSSSLLKCTVSFTYDRYLCSAKQSSPGIPGEPASPATAAGVPDPFSGSLGDPTSNLSRATERAIGQSDYSNLYNNVSPNQLNRQPSFTQNEIDSYVSQENLTGNNYSSTGEDADEINARINFR